MKMITILGPTASGKTTLAAALAAHLQANGTPAEIISADSRQVYRRMDIGTGKDLADYRHVVDGSAVDIPYHLIDIVPAGAKFNIYQYQEAFAKAYADVRSRGAIPILCGGRSRAQRLQALTRATKRRAAQKT